MAFNTAANITAFVNTVYEGALLVARDNNVMASLVTVYNDRSGTAIRSLQTYGTATINTIGETDDLSSQTLTPSVLATLTPAEVGAQFFITDLRVETDPFPIQSDASMELGMALAQSLEKNLLGNFSSLTGGTVGAAGTTITWGHVMAMNARLRAQNAPGPYFMVLHPYQWHQLGKAASVASSVSTNAPPDFLSAIQRQYWLGSAYGIQFFNSSNIAIDGSDDAYCALFSRQSLALDIRRGMRVEPERDSSRRGYELNLSMVYAHGVWRKAFGIQGLFDATAPTS